MVWNTQLNFTFQPAWCVNIQNDSRLTFQMERYKKRKFFIERNKSE